MKELTKAVVALDIETRSRPKESAFAGKIPIMTTFAFAAMTPDHELPYIFLGKMDVVNQVKSERFHAEEDTENWWKFSDRISNKVRDSQLRTWFNSTPLYAMVGPIINDYFNTGNTMSYVGSHQFEDVAQIFRGHLGKKPHVLGNGPEFDMSIFDLHFPEHKIYRFTEVGSARTLKWLARERFSDETYGYLEQNAEAYAKWVFSNLPESLIKHFDLVPSWHDALFDALAEVHLSHAILTDAIN